MTARAIPKAASVGAAATGAPRHLPAGSALLTEVEWEQTAHVLRLSGRELQIVRGVFDCRKEDAIAADLGIAPRTVDTHLERLYRKLTVTTRVALVLRVIALVLQVNVGPEPGRRSPLPAKPTLGRRARLSGEYPTSVIRSIVVKGTCEMQKAGL
jgi:DNA-binding CsgD family transcriptional regulator